MWAQLHARIELDVRHGHTTICWDLYGSFFFLTHVVLLYQPPRGSFNLIFLLGVETLVRISLVLTWLVPTGWSVWEDENNLYSLGYYFSLFYHIFFTIYYLLQVWQEEEAWYGEFISPWCFISFMFLNAKGLSICLMWRGFREENYLFWVYFLYFDICCQLIHRHAFLFYCMASLYY